MNGEEPRKEEEAVPLDDAAAEPAAMRLRAEPPHVTRLSRKALAAMSVVASLGVGGAMIFALQTRDGGKPKDELYTTDVNSTPDGLGNLPRDYSGVPQLGPPLPGDLGRPILSAQNDGKPVPAPGMGTPADPSVDVEAQRWVQESETARTSRMFTGGEGRTTGTPGVDLAAAVPMPPSLGSLGFAPPPATTSAQERQQAFLAAPADQRTIAIGSMAGTPSPNILQAGAVIPAALITGIRSDLPGPITAQVTQNVYDSPTGRILLIPQGTRIIGQYDNDVGFGQSRVLLVWTRLILPNGRSIVLDRQPGANAEGYAGLQDGVDYHWGDLAKSAVLSTLISIGANTGSSGDEGGIARAIRQGASDSVSQTGQQIVGRQLNIASTLTIRPGYPMRVIVTRDLVLEPFGG